MRLVGWTAALLLAGTSFWAACGSDIQNASATCVVGQTQLCAGPAGCSGFQECIDGASFGPCQCDDGSGGGMTSASGGSSQGGTTSTANGGSSQGGNATGGSAAGGSGTGGSMMAMCPSAQPVDDDACGDQGLSCDYASTTCVCDIEGMNGLDWDCFDCPATEPTGSCTDGAASCDYGATTCECNGFQNPSWECYQCPASEPMDGDSCTGSDGASCSYGDTDCECVGFMNQQWACSTCPGTQPTGGDMCSDPGAFCSYMGTNCFCSFQQPNAWQCF